MVNPKACCLLLVLLIIKAESSERNSTCVTPNKEIAKCLPLVSCTSFLDGILSGDPVTVKFAQDSQCGYDSEPLVCCGSTVRPTENVEEVRPIVDLNGTFVDTLPDRTICGIEKESFRLLGGSVTAIGEFPWMALIRYVDVQEKDVGFKCAGTLINNKFVLTAAHCVNTTFQGIRATTVRLGEWDTNSDPDCVQNLAVEICSDPVKDVKIEQEIVHPYYNSYNGNNDIALLKLKATVKFSAFISPICLPTPNFPSSHAGHIVTVSGWGATDISNLSNVKLKVDLPIVTTKECSKHISNSTLLSSNQICAGGVVGKDSCYGDSGGPLMRTYQDVNYQWYQEGIVSRGRGCSRSGIPGIYTRVSRYIVWIRNNIREEQ